jgi:hypothetical protein
MIVAVAVPLAVALPNPSSATFTLSWSVPPVA